MKHIMVWVALLLPAYATSQTVFKGELQDFSKKPVANASLYLLDLSANTVTDSIGNFQLVLTVSVKSVKVVCTHSDYLTDTFDLMAGVSNILYLKPSRSMKAFVFKSQGPKSAYIDNQTVKTEVITTGELKKSACCDLAGCFETQGTVQPMTTNILTNSKELRILGLSGVYNQVLVEGLPLIIGLSYTYGISGIPGTLVDNIFVSKGTTSVLQGFESMVGQINIIPKNPSKGEKLLFNAYVNSFGESQYNINYRMSKGKLSNIFSLHMVQPAQKWDRDKDGFLDLPKLTRYMVFDKLKFGDESKDKFSATLGMRYLWEQRIGGQTHYNPNTDKGSVNVYGQSINFGQPDLYFKSAFKISENKRIALFSSGFMHQQNSWIGSVNYKANQKYAYANLQYEQDWRDKHAFKTGVSYRYLNIDEEIGFSDTLLKRTYDGNYLKLERIPGVFAENTFNWRGGIITLITGLRADRHELFGWKVTPRSMLKYDVTEMSTLRASIGTGWRTVNLFSENMGLMVSSRNIIFKEVLEPESSLNWGVNALQRFKFKHVEGFVTSDFYQTRFSNQFFPDYDSDPNLAYVGNFKGQSISNGFQVDLNSKLYKLFEFKMAYNYLDVYRIVNGSKFEMPFNSRHKVLLSLSYVPKNKKWRADMNAHWFGKQRLPNTEMNPEEYRQAPYSRSYTTFNIQATRSWKWFEIYGGCENILDYRQLRPIVSWQNPFSPYFDTSFNWGPTRGRELYLGIRYLPDFKKKAAK